MNSINDPKSRPELARYRDSIVFSIDKWNDYLKQTHRRDSENIESFREALIDAFDAIIAQQPSEDNLLSKLRTANATFLTCVISDHASDWIRYLAYMFSYNIERFLSGLQELVEYEDISLRRIVLILLAQPIADATDSIDKHFIKQDFIIPAEPILNAFRDPLAQHAIFIVNSCADLLLDKTNTAAIEVKSRILKLFYWKQPGCQKPSEMIDSETEPIRVQSEKRAICSQVNYRERIENAISLAAKLESVLFPEFSHGLVGGRPMILVGNRRQRLAAMLGSKTAEGQILRILFVLFQWRQATDSETCQE